MSAGNQPGARGLRAFDSVQQAATREIMEVYLRALTGIEFVETLDGGAAEVHFGYQDIADSNTAGLCAWSGSYTPGTNGEVLNYAARAWIYLDDVQFRAENMNLGLGSFGRETLLHEIGHMLGLKHPHEAEPENPALLLSPFDDNSDRTLMSYNRMLSPYDEFRVLDVAALHWLYGGDGLGGELGMNSRTGGLYLIASELHDTLTGGSGNDRLQGQQGDDQVNGGEGEDTAVFRGLFADYTVSTVNGKLRLAGPDGADTLDSIELIAFNDRTLGTADLYDRSAPQVTLAVRLNAAGYAEWGQPMLSGATEARAQVTVYEGATALGTVQAESDGRWVLWITDKLSNGAHSLTAIATDLAGNVSAASAAVSFLVDVTPPSAPTVNFARGPSDNQLTASGSADAGTVVQLAYSTWNSSFDQTLAEQAVGADGQYHLSSLPLPNGDYIARISSTDMGGNASYPPSGQSFHIASPLSFGGSDGNDIFIGNSGNNAFNGSYGIDAVRFSGARAEYSVQAVAFDTTYITQVLKVQSERDGLDGLYSIERLHFSDVSVAYDIGNNAGMAYRLYRAAFDREPDKAGVGFWIGKIDQGAWFLDVAAGFIASAEFAAMYGPAPTDYDFVARLYQHVLHRAPDGAGFNFWLDMLEGGETRARVLYDFSASTENVAQVADQIALGFEFLPYG